MLKGDIQNICPTETSSLRPNERTQHMSSSQDKETEILNVLRILLQDVANFY